jgi:hypothetical protein
MQNDNATQAPPARDPFERLGLSRNTCLDVVMEVTIPGIEKTPNGWVHMTLFVKPQWVESDPHVRLIIYSFVPPIRIKTRLFAQDEFTEKEHPIGLSPGDSVIQIDTLDFDSQNTWQVTGNINDDEDADLGECILQSTAGQLQVVLHKKP